MWSNYDFLALILLLLEMYGLSFVESKVILLSLHTLQLKKTMLQWKMYAHVYLPCTNTDPTLVPAPEPTLQPETFKKKDVIEILSHKKAYNACKYPILLCAAIYSVLFVF